MPARSKEELYFFLIAAAKADGQINDDESRALEEARRRLDLSPDEAAEALSRAISGYTLPPLPEDHESLLELHDELLRIVTADGSVTPLEQEIVDRVRKRLGLPAGEVKEEIKKKITDRLDKIDPGHRAKEVRSAARNISLTILILAAGAALLWWIVHLFF